MRKNTIPKWLGGTPKRERVREIKRIASLRRIVAQPKGGELTEYLRRKARIELLAYEMGR